MVGYAPFIGAALRPAFVFVRLLEVPMIRWQQHCDRLVRYGCGIIGAGTQARTPWSGSPWFLIIAAPWRSDEIQWAGARARMSAAIPVFGPGAIDEGGR